MKAKFIGIKAIIEKLAYPNDSGSSTVYNNDSETIAYETEKWCKKNEDDPTLRIALCGYNGTYNLMDWDKYYWKANGGYANQGNTKNENCYRETVWFSPSCRGPKQESLL